MEFDKSGLETYLTDKDLEAIDGVWLKFPGDRKVHILRAGGSNSKFSRTAATITKPYQRQIQRGTIDPEKVTELMLDIYLQSVILDWKGFKDAEGKEIPYSREVAREFFTQVPEMFSELMELAGDLALFQDQEVEETSKHMGES